MARLPILPELPVFRRLLRSQRQTPCRLVTDKLGSYGVAYHDLMASLTHDTAPYANNRAEASHQPTQQRERHMRDFSSPDHVSVSCIFTESCRICFESGDNG